MTRPNHWKLNAAVLPVMAVCSASGGQIVPVSQDRNVHGDANAGGGSGPQQHIDTHAASDFGPFVDTLIVSASTEVAMAVVEAAQQSNIGPCELQATGSIEAAAEVEPGGVFAYGIGVSEYRVVFDLSQPVTARLAGLMTADDAAQVRLTLSRGAVIVLQQLVEGESRAIAAQVDLAPGTYTLLEHALGAGFVQARGSHSMAAGFDLRFSVCFEPADLNIDGGVDVADLLLLLSGWGPCPRGGPGECLADLDGDLAVSVSDLLTLLAAWR
jgi:hypothetical protein